MLRPVARAAGLVVGMLAAGLLLAGPAVAHATVVTSDPADGARLKTAPSTVTITFDENVGIGGAGNVGYLHVTNRAGAKVDARAAYHPGGDGTKVADELRSRLGDGTYTASFRVISADSHPVAGTIRFVVGNGALVHGSLSGGTDVDAATSAAFDVSRWVSYAGLALLGGSWLLFTIWPAGRDVPRARRVAWTGWIAAVLGALFELSVQGPYSAGDGLGHLADTTLLDATLHTDYGVLHSVRLILLGALAVGLGRSLREGAEPAKWEITTPVLGVGVLATFSGTGHAFTTSPAWLSMPIDMAHLAAMAIWLGGLVLLLTAVLPRRDPDELRTILPVFSTTAFACVVVLAVTGGYAALRGIGTINAVFTTTYGLLVIAKIVFFVALLALGNLSRNVVRRRAARPKTVAYAMTDATLQQPAANAPGSYPDAADSDGDDDGLVYDALEVERLRRSVYIEVLVGIIVLALTAVLVAEPRGKEALVASYREPISASASLGNGRSMTVSSDTGVHGPVDIKVTLNGGSQSPAEPAKITATATQQHAQIGPLPIALTNRGDGRYDGTTTLPVAGSWDIALVVTTSTFDATTTDVTLVLH